MTAQGAGRPPGRLAAVARVAGERLRHGGRRATLALLLVAGLGAWTGAIAGAPAVAASEKAAEGESPGGATEPSPTGSSSCPSSNPPNQLALVAGTPQTATLDTAFASGLQVALTNGDGCPVTGAAGVPVTFTAPAAGASGLFSASNSDTATVGADASGTVAAPTFTANDVAGSYVVTASSRYGAVSFSLTNTAAGIPARLAAIPLRRRSASITGRFPQPLQVKVLDANGDPVAGATVTFALGTGNAGSCPTAAGTGTAPSASFAGGGTQTGAGTQATATTGADGVATSPAFTANATTGSFTATASVSGDGGSGSAGGGESAGKAGAATLAPVGFSLVNLAGKPAKLAPGVGATQSTAAGTAFPIRLAVTVTDAHRNPVPGALVTFSAPAAAASGHFTIRSRGPRRHRVRVALVRTVAVETGACGIAVAPPFTAGREPGGYIVEASARPAGPTAFALVNEAP